MPARSRDGPRRPHDQGRRLSAAEARSDAPKAPSAPDRRRRRRSRRHRLAAARPRRSSRTAGADVAFAPACRRSGWCNRKSTAAILTTFNEVNMAPVLELRARYKERFEKEHGVKLGFMGFFVKAAVARAENTRWSTRRSTAPNRLPRLFRHRHRRRQPARPGRADPARRRPDVDRRDRKSRSPTSASARRTASSRSRS